MHNTSFDGLDNRSEDKNLIQSHNEIRAKEILAEAQRLIPKTDEAVELTAEYLLNTITEDLPCLLEPFLQKIGLACLAGSSDIGKSTLLRQLAISVVTGSEHFLDFPLHTHHKSVLFVPTEDYKQATASALRKQKQDYLPEDLSGLRFLFEYEDLLNDLDKCLTKAPADLVAIDCFQDAFGGNLKDTQAIRVFLHPYQKLAEKHKCLIMFLHHTGKRTENLEPSKNNLLSGQGLEAKMRLVIELRADVSNPYHRHLCVVKGNYLSSRFKKESYVLYFNEEDFMFTNTGERTLFEMLAKQPSEDTSKAKYEEAKRLKNEGNTYEQIAEKLSISSKGTISKLFSKAREKGWDKGDVSKTVSEGNDGNGNEEVPF